MFDQQILELRLYCRNVWKEPLTIIPSHLIKSVVMQKVLEKEKDYWKKNFNLEKNFLECFSGKSDFTIIFYSCTLTLLMYFSPGEVCKVRAGERCCKYSTDRL